MTTAAAPQSPLLSELAAVAAVAGVNVAVSRAPRRWELPLALGGAGLMLALASGLGAAPSREGLDPANVRPGMRLGLLVGLPLAGAVIAGSLIPAVRKFYYDERIAKATADDIAYHVLARIPFATAMCEEIIFRSALVGVFRRRHSPFRAAVLSSALFGAWHILPTIDRLHTNPGVSAVHGRSVHRQALTVAAVVGATAVAGMGFCWLQWRSRSVVAPIVVHGALNGAGYLAGWLGSRRDAGDVP